MKNFLSYACCLLAAAASAYEVSSFSTASSPVFVKTADGSADLTYPVASENTFGSPDWYEHAEYIGTPAAWKMVVDGNVISNKSGQGQGPDRWHSFDFHCEPPYYPGTIPSSTGETSEWFVTYDFMKFNYAGMFGYYGLDQAVIPGMSTNADSRAWFVDAPYDDWGFVQSHDITGPGTIEFRFRYPTDSTNSTEMTNCATLFPVLCPANITSTYVLYPDAYDPPEIWLPKFQRLTPASRSALMAAYEAYFERMYYGSKGVTDDGEDEDEWTLWQLGSPDADADFIFRAPPFWNTNDQHSAKLLDGFYYPGSAYSDTNSSPSARRHYPSSCFRLMDEATNVARLAYSMRHLSPFVVESSWLGHGAIPDETLRNETPFLSRPQWLLDGRTVPGHYTASGCEHSYLWWSSQVAPPPVQQNATPNWGYEMYTPDFSSVFPVVDQPVYYAEDGVTDSYIPYDASGPDLLRNVKPAQYAFTFNCLDNDYVFTEYMDAFPMKSLFYMLDDAMCGLSFSSHFMTRVDYDFAPYTPRLLPSIYPGLTVPGFATNCIRQAARSLPYRPDAMAAYETRLAETSQTFRVDSAPVAAASHILGLMDRTIHIPFQEFVCTNWVVEGRSGGYYAGSVSQGDPTNVIELTGVKYSDDGTEWGLVPNGKPTSFAVRNTRTNAVEECVDRLETKSVDSSIQMFARSPSDIPDPGGLASVGAHEENLPHKSFKVGGDAVRVGGVKVPDGDFALAGPVAWHGPDYDLSSGPDVHLIPRGSISDPVYSYVLTHYPSNYVPRVIISRGPLHDLLDLFRGYMFCDKDSVECGMTLGPVQAGVIPDKGDASHYAGILLGGSVDAENEHGDERQYDFISSFSGAVTSRSGLLSWIDGKAGDLSATLSDRIKDAARCGLRDPRKPGEYAPMPEWYEQKATAVGEPDDHVLSLKVDPDSIRLTKTEEFPVGTADKYVFDVTTRVETAGFVDYSCVTERYVTIVADVDEYWNLVDYPYGNDYYLDRVVTNRKTIVEDWSYGDGPYKVRDETIHSVVTTEITRVVMSGGEIQPWQCVLSSNVTYTTAFDSLKEDFYQLNVTVWRQSPYVYDPEPYYVYDERTDYDSLFLPWPLDPIVRKEGTVRTETVELNPADAKSHEVVIVDGVYTYSPVISVADGKVARISFESSDPNAPTIPDADEFIVANEIVDEDILHTWAESWFEYGHVTNNAPANANWTGSFDGRARPAVMTWTDWIWNALKRD